MAFKRYRLVGKTPVESDFPTWAIEANSRTPSNDPWSVARHTWGDDEVCVSTVFLGANMQEGYPTEAAFFETMVSGDPFDHTERHRTFDEAVVAHFAHVEGIELLLGKPDTARLHPLATPPIGAGKPKPLDFSKLTIANLLAATGRGEITSATEFFKGALAASKNLQREIDTIVDEATGRKRDGDDPADDPLARARRDRGERMP